MEYYKNTRKKKILPFEARQMNLEGIMINEMSHTEKDKYYMLSPSIVESKNILKVIS